MVSDYIDLLVASVSGQEDMDALRGGHALPGAVYGRAGARAPAG
jgi:hypothetical protein